MPGRGGSPILATKPIGYTPSAPSPDMTSLTAREIRDIVFLLFSCFVIDIILYIKQVRTWNSHL
jgi:hypothetical protein